MTASLGQYCLNVADLDRSVAWYTALGLECTSHTEIAEAYEAIVENPATGGKLQLAQQKAQHGPVALGNGFWKLYVNAPAIATTFDRAIAGGAEVVSSPERMDRWPVSIAFVSDPDGYQVELVQRHPWADADPRDAPWLGQYCLNVSHLDASVAFYERLGLSCTSRTEIAHAYEAIVEQPGIGGKLQLAQQKRDDELDLAGALWKLYVNTDDCAGLYQLALAGGATTVMAPVPLERWPVTIAFVTDRDGYLIEFVERHVAAAVASGG